VVVTAVWDDKEVLEAALEGSNPIRQKADSTAASQEERMRVDTISGSTRSLNITATSPSSPAGRLCSSPTARRLVRLSLVSVSSP
jgi:hypothetical protein